jgi:hypothetical protein
VGDAKATPGLAQRERAGVAPDEAATLAAVLDCLVPADPARGLPAAGALGVAGYVIDRLGDAIALIRPGLAALDAGARARGAQRFADLARVQREELLRAHAASDPGFVPGLLFQTYAGYYQNPAVLEALGLEGRPPHPKGYEIGPDDPQLLDPVRARAPFYREP